MNSSQYYGRHPYVSHIICNAGLANFVGFDWPLAIKQILTEVVTAVTRPLYKLQLKGQTSGDGLGLIMQCNVLSHYFLVSYEPVGSWPCVLIDIMCSIVSSSLSSKTIESVVTRLPVCYGRLQ